MQKQFSISVAKNKLPAIIHAVEDGSAVQFTRHGNPVAVLISYAKYQGMVNRKKDFWSSLSDFNKRLQETGGLLEDEDLDGLRDKSQGRDVTL